MENTFSTFGEKVLDYAKEAGTLALDSAIAAQPIIGVPAGLLGFESTPARERREDREFKQAQREFALKKMAHYDEDRKARLAREQKEDEYLETSRKNALKTQEYNLLLAELRTREAHKSSVKRFSDEQSMRMLKSVGSDVTKQVEGFGGPNGLNNAQMTEMLNSRYIQEYKDISAVVKYADSTNPAERDFAFDLAKNLGFTFSKDGKSITVAKDGKTYPWNEQTKKYLLDSSRKEVSENAVAIKQRDAAREYIDGDTTNKFIDAISKAYNHPRNDNRGNLRVARDTYYNILKDFSQIERSQFQILAAGKNFLADNFYSEEEKMKFGPQLDYWAKNFGFKYTVSPEGQVTVFDKDGNGVNGKEFFENAFNNHTITKALKRTIDGINSSNKQADEQAKLKEDMQKAYSTSDALNSTSIIADPKLRELYGKTAYEQQLLLKNLNERNPNGVDDNILKVYQFGKNQAGDNYISPYDVDVDEINLENSQHNLSSLDDKVIKQAGVASRKDSSKLVQTPSLISRGHVYTQRDKETEELKKLVNQRNKAQEKYNEHKSRYEQSSKRHGNLKRNRKSNNKKDK